jgi:hypothetical protein
VIKKSLCIFALGFRITDIQKRRHINKILKIQSNEQRTFQPSKEKESTDLWTEWLLRMEEKFLREEELKEDIN